MGEITSFDDGIHGTRTDPAAFLATHRALGACTRELALLSEELVDRVASLRERLSADKEVVRRQPGKCIVQLGPVAIAMAWLKGSPDVVAGGQLMIGVWRGSIAPSPARQFERPAATSPATASLLWEVVLVPEAERDSDWKWSFLADGARALSAAQLAGECVARLEAAYMEAQAA